MKKAVGVPVTMKPDRSDGVAGVELRDQKGERILEVALLDAPDVVVLTVVQPASPSSSEDTFRRGGEAKREVSFGHDVTPS